MNKLYKIWLVQCGKNKPCFSICTPVEFDPVAKTWAYSLVSVIDVLTFNREDIVSRDLQRIEDYCKYLNEMADADVYYEIREYKQEEYV